ncbi:MAG: DUF3127 domain-containing protein [Bacteroidales bacterium]|nr:DUF3127 domain-containing protein [Bacteroidales bacterium]
MALEIEGKLTKIMPERSGEGRNGHWSVIDLVIEIPGQFVREAAFSIWNNRIDISTLQIGENIKVSFDISSRPGTTGQYFTSLTAWKIDKLVPGQAATQTQPVGTASVGQTAQPAGPVEQPQAAGSDDLPF